MSHPSGCYTDVSKYYEIVSYVIGRVVIMAFVAFVLSLIVTGAVASLLDVEAGTSRMDQPDYHFVPFAGDAFGA